MQRPEHLKTLVRLPVEKMHLLHAWLLSVLFLLLEEFALSTSRSWEHHWHLPGCQRYQPLSTRQKVLGTKCSDPVGPELPPTAF
jgi:hypothetical protein